jgi:urease accessory protein
VQKWLRLMSVAVLRSDNDRNAAAALSAVRVRGGVSVAFKSSGDGATRLADLHEYGGFRAKLPRTHGLTEAVVINTGGGLLGGDQVRFEIDVAAGAAAQITTQSAERVYRSLGPDCRIELALSVAAGGRLHWLPQETILFNEARLVRTISADVAADAALLMVEATVFGRAAMDETVVSGLLRDVWRIRRDGVLVYADTVRLSGDIAALLQQSAVGAGASTMATVLFIAPDAPDRLEGARAAIAEPAARAAVSTWNGLLIGRFLAPSAEALKTDVARLVAHLTGFAMPRVWGMM